LGLVFTVEVMTSNSLNSYGILCRLSLLEDILIVLIIIRDLATPHDHFFVHLH
jgi:hypothetical protein